jgi:hypothetical protein
MYLTKGTRQLLTLLFQANVTAFRLPLESLTASIALALFVWVTETKNYENFKKQSFHDKNKKAYPKDSPYHACPGVVQMVFEVDMRRIYQFSYDAKIDKPINMTKKKAAEIETAVDTVCRLKKYGYLVTVRVF